jgi:ankyrin repeat protein
VYSTIESASNRRLVIHELCRLGSFPVSPETSGEISEDEDEDTVDEGRTAACLQCAKEDKKKICELIKFMIDISHTLGPVKVLPPPPGESDNTSRSEEKEDGFQVHVSILTVMDSFKKTPLHVLCENSADTQLLRMILESTRENKQNPCALTALSLICAKDSRGSTPLHYLAYSRQCPFSSLELLMDYCKPSFDQLSGIMTDPTLCTDIDGETPLHWALDGYMSPRRIELLVRHSKDAVRIQNMAGRRPFDQFVGNFVDSDWQLHELCGREMWGNIQEYLKVLMKKKESEEEEWLPIHMLAGSSIDFPSVFSDIALHYNKEDLSKPNSKGLLPLHLACARESMNPETPCDGTLATKILVLYPQAAYKTAAINKRERLAIHMAVESRKPLPLIAALLKAYPNSLNKQDPITRLWPFLLASANNEDNVETSYCLLRADPSIIQIAIQSLISKRGQRAV